MLPPDINIKKKIILILKVYNPLTSTIPLKYLFPMKNLYTRRLFGQSILIFPEIVRDYCYFYIEIFMSKEK